MPPCMQQWRDPTLYFDDAFGRGYGVLLFCAVADHPLIAAILLVPDFFAAAVAATGLAGFASIVAAVVAVPVTVRSHYQVHTQDILC